MTISPGESTKSLTELVAAEIRVAMARQGIRQSQLARKLGVNDTWLSVRLRGVQAIDLNDLERIADGLGVTVVDLIPTPVTSGARVTRGNLRGAEKPRSARVSTERPKASPKSASTRPGRGTPRPDTRRPAMLPRPVAA